MEKQLPARYFLGANSARGFASLYDGFTDPAAGDFLWVIKGGPGCGKSTLMKRIGAAAAEEGEAVEYIHCSGDPDSLDGVRLPGLRVAYVDGTAPHVIECQYPGASSKYLDMSRFLDAKALRPLQTELAERSRAYKALYGEAYGLLAAATALLPKNSPGLPVEQVTEKLSRKAENLAARELHPLKKEGKLQKRFLSAVSCQGRVLLWDTLRAGEYRLCLLDNRLGLGHTFIERMSTLAAERGYDAILCPDPLEPEKPEALLLPEAKLAFLAAEGTAVKAWRHLRLDALLEKLLDREDKEALRSRGKESARMLGRAVATLARAKALHDGLEALYHPHVDFDGAAALAEEQIRMLFP